MSAKSKSSKKNDNEPYSQLNTDPELEKKVDEMLSLDPIETDTPPAKEEPAEPQAEQSVNKSDEPKPSPKPSKKIKVSSSDEEDTTDVSTPKDNKTSEATGVPPVIEAGAASAAAASAATAASSTTPAETLPPEPDTSGPPLLPTEEIPVLDKKKKIAVNVFDESNEPKAEESPPEEPVEPIQSIKPKSASEEIEELEPIEPVTPEKITPESTIAEAEAAAEAEPETDQLSDDIGIESPSTDKAVDEIIAEEADELFAARDKKFHDQLEEESSTRSKKSKKKRGNIFAAWWHNKPLRNATFILLFAALIGVVTFPSSRYFMLNSAGVRVSSTVKVLDDTTGQPLKNATFSIGDTAGKTDSEGVAKLEKLKLGPSTMTVKKTAFSDVNQPIILGWGSNPLGDFKLKPVGTQFSFLLTDFLTKSPVSKAEAQSGEADARANEKGELTITIPRSEAEKDEITVQISSENYRTETLKFAATKKDRQAVQMVPSKKHVFISKRSGKYDVYKIDVDGKNEEKVFAGTGSEKPETMALSIHPNRNIAALVSTRGAVRNEDGFQLNTLTLIDLSDNSTTKITDSERIQLIDWVGKKLVYVKIAEGESAASTNRHRLISYDTDSHTERELASTNYFNDVVAVNDNIYYSPALYQVNGQVGLYKINMEGNNRKMITDKEAWNLFRTSYDKISVSIGQDWYDLNLTNDAMTKANGPPPQLKSRVYIDNPSGNSALWTEERDGKGVLISYDRNSKSDKVLQTQSGLKNPIRWLDADHIIYRVATNQETADYIMGSNGGESRKIRDVTDTAGIDRWYYY